MSYAPKREKKEKEREITIRTTTIWGVRGSVVVEALCYKPEGRGIDRVPMRWIFF
jgi:hypothetical protein